MEMAAYTASLDALGLVPQSVINPLLAVEDIVARIGFPVYTLSKWKQNRVQKVISQLIMIGEAMLRSHLHELDPISLRNALLLNYSSASVVYTFTCKVQRMNDNSRENAITLLESTVGDTFSPLDGAAPLGEDFDVATRPIQRLIDVGARFSHLITCMADNLDVDEVPFEFKDKPIDDTKKIRECLRASRLKDVMRVLKRHDVQPIPAEIEAAEQGADPARLNEVETRALFVSLFPHREEPAYTVAQANHDRDRALDDNTFNGMPDVGMEVKEEELEDILPRLDNSSSSGPCGMTNCLLKSLAHVQDTGGYSSAWFRRALCFQLTRIVQCTNICESERRILAMSKVCFIPKGEQGKFRPLGITATIARLASKILLKRSAAYVATILPHQLAIGIPDGATLGAELMQTLLEKDYMVALFDASTNSCKPISPAYCPSSPYTMVYRVEQFCLRAFWLGRSTLG
jgi:hypothetical protein